MMDRYKQHIKEWKKAYQRVSSLTKIPVEDLVDRCMVLVKDGDSPYYGMIGILENEITDWKNHKKLYVVVFGERKKVKFEIGLGHYHTFEEVDKKLFYTPNAPLLLEERDKINKRLLFD